MAISNSVTRLLGIKHPIVLAPMDLVAHGRGAPCRRIEDLIGDHHKWWPPVFLAHGKESCARAKAIMRDRTQLLTSGVGGTGAGVLFQGGNAPNFVLYWCATQPGL